MIPQSTIDQVLDANPIVDVVGGYFPLKRSGGSYSALCPFHNEKSPSFTVNPARGTYKCFGCGAGGSSAIRFVMEYEKLSFPEAVKKLADKAGVSVETEEESAASKQKARMVATNEKAMGIYMDILMDQPEGIDGREYLRNRKFNREICKKWGIGYAPDADSLSHLGDRIVEAGLGFQNSDGSFVDRFKDRIVFSILNTSGKVIGFSARTIAGHPAKYVNTPENILFTKGDVLFGLNQSKRAIIEQDCAVIVEGQMDCIRMIESGIENTVAPLGTAFTQNHAKNLRRLCSKTALMLDADNAGREAAYKAFCILSSYGFDVKNVVLPDGVDPDSALIAGMDLQAMIDAAPGYIESYASTLPIGDPAAKMECAEKISKALLNMSEPILRDALAEKVAPMIGVTGKDMVALVRRVGRGLPITRSGDTAQQYKTAIIELCRALAFSLDARDAVREIGTAELIPEDAEIVGTILYEDELVGEAAMALLPKGIDAAAASFPASSDTPEKVALTCVKILRRDAAEGKVKMAHDALADSPHDGKKQFAELMEAIRELEKVKKDLNEATR